MIRTKANKQATYRVGSTLKYRCERGYILQTEDGTEDRVIPSVMSERFVEALDESGVDNELLLVDASHGFEKRQLDLPANVESLAAIEQFIAGLP